MRCRARTFGDSGKLGPWPHLSRFAQPFALGRQAPVAEKAWWSFTGGVHGGRRPGPHFPMSAWYILGAGNMGVLAGFYISRAGMCPRFVIPGTRLPLERTLIFEVDGCTVPVRFDAVDPEDVEEPVERLIVATKAWQTTVAMAPLTNRLMSSVELVCLQNGMGSLDRVSLPPGARLIKAITTNGGWRLGDEHHVVAENSTLLGDGGPLPPSWFVSLRPHWPGLQWCADIDHQQLRKLAVNAVINPLTAVFDCVNGALIESPELFSMMESIAAEVDEVLVRLDAQWRSDTMERSVELARVTAGNTSSMRSDMRAGLTTEIDFINGWLIRQADRFGLPLPENRRLCRAIRDALASSGRWAPGAFFLKDR